MVKCSHSCLLCLCGTRVFRYILILAKLNGRGRPFLKGAKRGATLWHYPQEHLVGIRDEKVSFCEIWDNPTPPLFLVELLTSKHCRTWSKLDMINLNLWIDSVHWVINFPWKTPPACFFGNFLIPYEQQFCRIYVNSFVNCELFMYFQGKLK